MSGFYSSFNFNGAGVGLTQVPLDNGFYEIGALAVPEPSIYGMVAGALGLLIGVQVSRRSRVA